MGELLGLKLLEVERENATLRATNERLVRALRDFLICADGEAEDGDIPKKALWNVREAARAALTATQEKGNGNG